MENNTDLSSCVPTKHDSEISVLIKDDLHYTTDFSYSEGDDIETEEFCLQLLDFEIRFVLQNLVVFHSWGIGDSIQNRVKQHYAAKKWSSKLPRS